MIDTVDDDIMLQARGLTKLYNEITALEDLDMTIPRGKIFGFIGHNGAGKTTSIAKLARLLISSGRSLVLVAGDTFRAAAVEQLTMWSQRLGCEIVTRPS